MLIETLAHWHIAINISSIIVVGAILKAATKLISLGVILDSRLSFTDHMSAVSKACIYPLWALRYIRHLLTLDVVNTMACSIVRARLYYCNAHLYEALSLTVARLQRLQDLMAQVVLQQPRRTHIESLLRSLHWLSIPTSITLPTRQLCLLTYKIRATSLTSYSSILILF